MSSYFETLNRHVRDVPIPRTPAPFPPVAARPVKSRPHALGDAMLRESLLARSNGHRFKVLVFAGCEGGEGCTQLVRGFAETLAASGLNVLVVNADTQTATEITGTGVPTPTSADQALVVGGGRVTLTRSPTSVRDKEHLFSGTKLAAWIETQRRTYDYVLVDAPPLLRFADGVALGRLGDGVVLVAQAGKTRGDSIARAREKLEHADLHPLGVVLNRTSDPVPPSLRRHFKFLRD